MPHPDRASDLNGYVVKLGAIRSDRWYGYIPFSQEVGIAYIAWTANAKVVAYIDIDDLEAENRGRKTGTAAHL